MSDEMRMIIYSLTYAKLGSRKEQTMIHLETNLNIIRFSACSRVSAPSTFGDVLGAFSCANGMHGEVGI